jgi:hypothetical protein
VVQIPHVWLLNAYESRNHLEEVKRPTSKDINFPVRHQVRIDSRSHQTPPLDRKSKLFVKVKEIGT